ncbi:MAG TPA: VWA domain-containing protein [Chthoniobacterales bacterium]|nr:VWA domain-containing protein [Chthoniobacterales bacterium]
MNDTTTDLNMALEDAVEFAENPEPRCACILLLDTSASMQGAPLDALSAGLQTFKHDLGKSPLTLRRAEIAIVGFDDNIKVLQDFVTADRFEPPTISQLGSATHMCAGIDTALDMVHNRKTEYRKNGVTYYRPWVFMITDGEPTGEPPGEVNRIAERVRDDEANKRVSFYCVGVESANMETLRKISVRQPIKLAGLHFDELFVWLSASMQRVSGGKTDEQVPLQPIGWGTAG